MLIRPPPALCAPLIDILILRWGGVLAMQAETLAAQLVHQEGVGAGEEGLHRGPASPDERDG